MSVNIMSCRAYDEAMGLLDNLTRLIDTLPGESDEPEDAIQTFEVLEWGGLAYVLGLTHAKDAAYLYAVKHLKTEEGFEDRLRRWLKRALTEGTKHDTHHITFIRELVFSLAHVHSKSTEKQKEKQAAHAFIDKIIGFIEYDDVLSGWRQVRKRVKP